MFLWGRRHLNRNFHNSTLLPMEDLGELVGTGQLIMTHEGTARANDTRTPKMASGLVARVQVAGEGDEAGEVDRSLHLILWTLQGQRFTWLNFIFKRKLVINKKEG